jgi:hypothetical protein
MSEEATTTQTADTQNQTQTTDSQGGDTGYTPSEFVTSLGDELSANESFKGIETPQDLAGKYLELNKTHQELQGQLEGIAKPPESPDAYELPAVPEGINFNEDMSKELTTQAHQLGITQDQLKGLTDWHFNALTAQRDAIIKANDDMMVSLKAEYKGKFDETVARVNQLVDRMPEFKAMLSQTISGENGELSLMRTNPHVFKALAKFASMISADSMPDDPGGVGGGERPKTADGRPMLNYPSMKK